MDYQMMALQKDMLPGLLALERACFQTPWTEGMFTAELENEVAVYRVILSAKKPVAYMGMWCVADEGQITNVAVSPAHRRKGLAVWLIRHYIELAQQKNLRLLTLEVRAGNEAAICLYKKMGFQTVGLRRNYYEGKEDAILMTLFLDKSKTNEGENKSA